MDIILKKLFITSQGVRNELGIAFGLILLAFLVFLGYLFPGVSSWFEVRSFLHVIVTIVFFIVVIGFIIIVQVIEPVIRISKEAAAIADGNFDREIKLFRQDEIGQLADALNRMTNRMKQNVEELKSFSETTEVVNKEMNRRVLMLSNLLQVSTLIAQNAQFSEVLAEGMKKCLSFEGMSCAGLLLKERETGDYYIYNMIGENSVELFAQGIKNVKFKLGVGLLGKALLRQDMVVMDTSISVTKEMKEFCQQFLMQSAVIVPVAVNGNVYGLLIVGNNTKGFVCPDAEREVYQLIAQQMAIACSNEWSRKQVERLEAVDRLTGLFNNTFIRSRLEEEIKKAVHGKRPCSFILMSIDHFDECRRTFGHIAAENFLVKISMIVKENIASEDKSSRFADHEFAIILPEKNKRQSIELAERIRKKIEQTSFFGNFSSEELVFQNQSTEIKDLSAQSFSKPGDSLKQEMKGLTCTVAVTENPIDGITAQDLIAKAEKILQQTA